MNKFLTVAVAVIGLGGCTTSPMINGGEGMMGGGAMGCGMGAALGAIGGPFAPATVPLGCVIGTVVGGITGGATAAMMTTPHPADVPPAMPGYVPVPPPPAPPTPLPPSGYRPERG